MQTRAEFSQAFNDAIKHLNLDDIALAKLFKVSPATIGRWKRAEAAPHPIGRKSIFDRLA